MKIGIFGTGSVGQTFSNKLVEIGHDVMLGTRDVQKTLSRTENRYGGPSFIEWQNQNKDIKLGTYAEAAAFGELLINATNGSASIPALKMAGISSLNSKVLIDIANPLEFNKTMPPDLISSLCNTNSLGEEIQRSFPKVKIVKAFNTMWCGIMVNPAVIGSDNHNVFICGNDNNAKITVTDLIMQFGWKRENIIDLGDISASRGTEMILPLWLRIMSSLKSEKFNFKIVRQEN